ncbi:hypothetical protein [uncultured Polaribacter sp.]|uniref:hypothetical protein n=1 Tax=uncultured Polaribacter sp. TaxID=174711 RepID=UPI002605268A|nr:hypothetical protein [uncultured Polaribacter sp.]
MKKIIFSFIFLLVASVTLGNEKEIKPTNKVKEIKVSSFDFDINGEILNFDFARAFCTETRDGVTYEANVGCFLCSPSKAKQRCARVLSRRIDDINPVVQEIY